MNFLSEHIGIILFIIILILIVLSILALRESYQNFLRREAEAKSIIDFCKLPHQFSDIKNGLSEITSLTYSELFDINFDIRNVQDDANLLIVFYDSDDVLLDKLIKKLEKSTSDYNYKIGSIQIKS